MQLFKPQGYLGLMQAFWDIVDVMLISRTFIAHCLGPLMTDEVHKFSKHSQLLDSGQEKQKQQNKPLSKNAQVKQTAQPCSSKHNLQMYKNSPECLCK